MIGRDRFLAACHGRPVDHPPIWIMRQAGRYLPEYRALRDSYTFEEMATRPDLAAEITTQPVTRYDMDAAILFSDILIPLTGMGRPARFTGHRGPTIEKPVVTPADVDMLEVPDPWERAPYVMEALGRVKKAVPDKAVIGFAGAPWTLAAYLIEGGSPEPFARTKQFAYTHARAFQNLLDKCADTVAKHLDAQFEAGADAVQLFDTWAETLSLREYRTLALPSVKRVFSKIRAHGRPIIYFARGTAHLMPALADTGANVLSVDWRTPLDEVARTHPTIPLQGNLDPTHLLAPIPRLKEEVKRVLKEGEAARGHVFNLGHGVLPMTPPEAVDAVVKTVRGQA